MSKNGKSKYFAPKIKFFFRETIKNSYGLIPKKNVKKVLP